MDSILNSVKKMLPVPEEVENFDDAIIMHINAVFSDLIQLGVGPSEGFSIQDKNAIWTDFLPAEPKWESVKEYTYLKVKLVFDPPQNTSYKESMERRVNELEFRLTIAAESKDNCEVQNGDISDALDICIDMQETTIAKLNNMIGGAN